MEMSCKKALDVMRGELACVQRAVTGCSRECERCDLVRDDQEVIAGYEVAIKSISACIDMIRQYKIERDTMKRLDNGEFRQTTLHDGAEWALGSIVRHYFPEEAKK